MWGCVDEPLTWRKSRDCSSCLSSDFSESLTPKFQSWSKVTPNNSGWSLAIFPRQAVPLDGQEQWWQNFNGSPAAESTVCPLVSQSWNTPTAASKTMDHQPSVADRSWGWAQRLPLLHFNQPCSEVFQSTCLDGYQQGVMRLGSTALFLSGLIWIMILSQVSSILACRFPS